MMNQSPWTVDRDRLASRTDLMAWAAAVRARVAVLNNERRIVWASPDLVSSLDLPAAGPLMGRRPGEIFGCVHAGESVLGCGAAEACYQCGAVEAVLESRRLGARVVRTARVDAQGPSGPTHFEVEVTASPWVLDDHPYTVLTIS